MRAKTFVCISLALTLVLAAGLGQVRAAYECPENFVLLVDQSGSMHMRLDEGDMKMAVSKRVLTSINELIPQANHRGANWTSALNLFAPVQEVYRTGPYDRAAMAQAVAGIEDDQQIFGRMTPMGPGILSLDPILSRMSGATAVILVTDGMANMGPDPVGEAQAIYGRYPDVCIHIISVADERNTKGREILRAINRLHNRSILVEGAVLDADRGATEEFVRNVFCKPAPEVRREEVLVLRGVQFDFDKYDIKPEFRVVLNQGAETLMARPDINVRIEGHTDGIGTLEYNQRLSERRARAVYDYFVAKGISPSRLQTVGYGKTRPIADNTTDEGRAINRRVELKVIQ